LLPSYNVKKWEGRYILIYVLGDESYRNLIKTNALRFVPDFLLPHFKPKIIENINTNEEVVIGKIVGINIKPINFLDKKQWDLFIEGIIKVKTVEDTKIYIEDFIKYPVDYLNKIECNTSLKFRSGDNIRISNIPLIIEKIYKSLGKGYNLTDTLIISDNKQKVIDTIKLLTDKINFFTVIGLDPLSKDELYEEILDCTGVSIFQPNNVDKIIKNYGTIINYNNKVDFEKGNVRNESVIIDFSIEKPFKVLESTNKRIIYVGEINFELNISNNWIGKFGSAELIECIDGYDNMEFSQIYTNNDFYFIDDFIKSEIKKRGRI